ncbi:hydroxymethylglutaryl-CoA reductase [Taklimakanibacter lacteus]|uniref:hydroxymethylglutaryl-CoA reductase n=1 Tax=Taklimakanibacter lacteus TaxID=2268456 RepID=UPI000E66E9FB
MSILPSHVVTYLKKLRQNFTAEEIAQRLSPKFSKLQSLRPSRKATAQSVELLWERLDATRLPATGDRALIADAATLAAAPLYEANIENFIGTVKVPVGLIGPLRVNGLHANGDYYVPLATTEAALVASYGRGAEIAGKAGGITSVLVSEGVLRSPAFLFDHSFAAGQFVEWLVGQADDLRQAAEATTSHGRLVSIDPFIDHDTVFLICRYTTGDASGQNMVTFATDALCRHIIEHTPVKPRRWFIEANFSGDKKASHLGILAGRGRKVTASVFLPEELIRKYLHCEVAAIVAYGQVANLGALLSGQIGAQAHYANGLAAFYIATGQDAACVAESAVGFTRLERRDDGVFLSVTLPNILVGSVGGGTKLPSQGAALRLMGLQGANKASALAEVAAALCLAGEISIIGAIAAGHFSRAHLKLARGSKASP